MRILVTGGTGFLGRHLLAALVAAGHHVAFQGRNRRLGEALTGEGARFHYAQLGDRDAMVDLCKDRDLVFHCAAHTSPWGPYQTFHEANVLGTRHVVEGCLANACRLVHVSTPGIYFNWRDRRVIREDDPLPAKPANHYAATKLQAEAVVDWGASMGLAAITLRPRAIFGPWDQTILTRILRVAKRRALPLLNGGKAFIDVTYVGNVVDALTACMVAPANCFGKKYNITNGRPMTVNGLFELLFQALKLPYRTRAVNYPLAALVAGTLEHLARLFPGQWEPPFTRYTLALIAKDQTLDIRAARRDLGYQPRVSIEEGLALFARWWEVHGGA